MQTYTQAPAKNPGLRHCHHLAIALCALFFVGCVAVPTIKPARSIEDFNKAANNEALVAVSVVVNTGEVGQLANLRLQRSDAPLVKGKPNPAPPEFMLGNVNDGASGDITLLVGSIPAGRYKVVQLDFFNKYLDLHSGPELGEIEVKAGKVYDLGMLVLTAANTKVIVGRSQKFTHNKPLFERYLPQQTSFQQVDTNPWLAPISERDQAAELFANMHPQGASAIKETATGEIVAGTRLGMVLARSPQGKWRLLGRTGTYDRVTAVIPDFMSTAKAHLVFTDHGDAYRLTNDIATRQNMGNLPKGRVFFADYSPETKRWYLGVNNDKTSELFSATNISGPWESLNSANVEFSTWSGARHAWIAELPDGLVLGSTSSPDIRCLSFTTNSWTTASIPNKRVLMDLRANPATGALGILTGPGGGIGGAFATPLLSSRCGDTWKEIKNPYKVQVAAPFPLADKSIAVVGGVFGDTGMYRSTDGGVSWKKQTDHLVLSEHLYQTATQGMFTVSAGFTGWEVISQSDDLGANWTTELSSFDSTLKN